MAMVTQADRTVQQRVGGGVLGGVVGGLVFGVLMAMMGMLPMVAGLLGSTSAAVGFILHLVFSAIIGAGFGLLLGGQSHTFGQGALWGLLYGAIWWVLGALLLMPTLLGMGPQFGMAFSQPMLMSLMGHLLYGAVTGLAYVWYTHR